MDYDYNMDFLSSPHTVEREASRRSQYSHDDIRNYLGGESDKRDMDLEDVDLGELGIFSPSELIKGFFSQFFSTQAHIPSKFL